jgi:hypothetical protein
MLNRLAAAMNTFVPVGSLLMDMLQFKDIHMKPTGGIGNALDFATTIKVCHLYTFFTGASWSQVADGKNHETVVVHSCSDA